MDFSEGYKEKLFNFINENTNYKAEQKQDLKNIITKLKNSRDFLKESLRFYTGENNHIYLFNRTMRKIEEGLERLSFLIGPMYYSMVRYLKKENPSLALNKNLTLFRKLIITKYEYNLYNMYVNNIICFPSFTSTSTSIKNDFSPTSNALKVNNVNEKESIIILMVLHYKHLHKNIFQGMFLNKYFSVNSREKEVLIFPFTFIKVNSLEPANDEDDCFDYKMDCDILNRDRILEFELKKGKKIVIDSNNVLTIQ